MGKRTTSHLSRRERQIMDIIYKRGLATAAEIHAEMADAPSYSTVRTILKVLKEKGHVRHKQDGPRYVYHPTTSPERAKRSALQQLLTTFFDGSIERAMETMIDMSSSKMSSEDFDRLSHLIDKAKSGENP